MAVEVDPIKVIARGGNPEWTHTFEHPEYGELTFKGKLPTAAELMRQSVAMDNLLAELGFGVEARSNTLLMAAAITGIQHILTVPVVKEERIEHEENHIEVKQTYYDPSAEVDSTFIVQVWSEFWVWRQGQLNRVDDLKNSSGETSGNGSSESSTATTDSPSTTPV